MYLGPYVGPRGGALSNERVTPVKKTKGKRRVVRDRSILSDLGFDALKKAEPTRRISFSVRLCWELEEPKGPRGASLGQ